MHIRSLKLWSYEAIHFTFDYFHYFGHQYRFPNQNENQNDFVIHRNHGYLLIRVQTFAFDGEKNEIINLLRTRSFDEAILHVIRFSLWFSEKLSKMSANKVIQRPCVICNRFVSNDRWLGPLQHLKTFSAHSNCVLYSPVPPDTSSFSENPEDSVAGMTSRFIRAEGQRAKRLVN